MDEVIKSPFFSGLPKSVDTIFFEGCQLLTNQLNIDNRGYFRNIFSSSGKVANLDFSVCQVNVSISTLAGTIRGFHYQGASNLESKLVSCLKGSVIDVLLDMRPTSKTFGKHTYYNLTPTSGSLLVPPLVAHGFQSLEDDTSLLYLHSNHYSPENSHGVNPLDPELQVHWPLPVSSISESDRNLPSFSEVKNDTPGL